MNWGSINLGRVQLREAWPLSEQASGERTVSLSGQESQPPLTGVQLLARHAAVLGLPGALVPVTFTDKSSADGYYLVRSASSTLTDYQGEVRTADWSLSLERLGSEGEVEIESRLTAATRANDHSLSGEVWHAPAIGHYGYYTGSSLPGVMTRTGEEGPVTVYRNVPAGMAPRWGCAPGDYPAGRVRILSAGVERVGTDVPVSPGTWELSNTLVRIKPASSGLEVASYSGGWQAKQWTVSVAGAAVTWNTAVILRNDFEQCVLRLSASRSPGRTVLDLVLRRGSRFVEGYLRTDTAGVLSVSLATAEATTSGTGYVVATNPDEAGLRYTAGSARSFTVHAGGGLSKSATTTLDFYLGAVVSAAAGDQATALRDQYLGAPAETTAVVRR